MSNQRQPTSTTGRGGGGQREHVAQLLHERGADDFPHVNGSLFDHLERTEMILRSWSCSETVSIAGLCHAVYGTDGVAVALLTLQERDFLSEIVGPDVEALVYFYASCDRGFVYPRLGEGDRMDFRDRFTGHTFLPSEGQLRDFVELTLANESDVGVVGPNADTPPDWLLAMFTHFQHLASASVRDGFQLLMSPAGR